MRNMKGIIQAVCIMSAFAFCVIAAPSISRSQTCPYYADYCFSGSVWDYISSDQGRPAIYRPTNGLWSVYQVTRWNFPEYVGWRPIACIPPYESRDTSPGFFSGQQWDFPVGSMPAYVFGTPSDLCVPGAWKYQDEPEIGVFRNGQWLIRHVTRFTLGQAGDWPVHGFWGNDDRICRAAIWRPSTGLWVTQDGQRFFYGTNGDIPLPGCYRGTSGGSWQAAIYRPSNGGWGIRGVTRFYFGTAGDWPLVADLGQTAFQLDSRNDDPVIFRPTEGLWRIKGTFYGGGSRLNFGINGDVPAVGPARCW